jgi:hypothetical protein
MTLHSSKNALRAAHQQSQVLRTGRHKLALLKGRHPSLTHLQSGIGMGWHPQATRDFLVEITKCDEEPNVILFHHAMCQASDALQYSDVLIAGAHMALDPPWVVGRWSEIGCFGQAQTR